MEESPTEIFGTPEYNEDDFFASDINFDRALPGLHQYLGTDFVDVSGRTYIEPGTETHMYSFYRDGVILVPGYTLPLIPYGPLESDLLQKINLEKRPLIFLPGYFGHHPTIDDFKDCIGITADMVSIRIPDREDNSSIKAIFVGRQRIRINKITRESSYSLVCHGIVLPEISLDHNMAMHPLGWGLIPRSWSRFASDPRSLHSAHHISKTLLQVTDSSFSDGRASHKRSPSTSSSSQPQTSYFPPAGNPMAIFDSRLSTWRHTGPISSGIVSLSSSSGTHLDHFVDDSDDQKLDFCDLKLGENKNSKRSRGDNNQELIAASSSSSSSPSCSEADTCTKSMAKHARYSSLTKDVELIMDRAVDRVGRPFRYRIKQPCEPRLLARRDILAAVTLAFTSLPVWACRQYDLDYLVPAIQTELYNWNYTWQMNKWDSKMAVPFSYWLIQNLPMPGPLKSYILGIDHVIQRLRALLDVIRRSSTCVCAYCDANITMNRYIICLAQEGSFQTYVNPSGIIHDVVTVNKVLPECVVLQGLPSVEYSWFPGYSWTIANCTRCMKQLGWFFTASKEELRPLRFWGLRRDAIVPGLISAPDWRPCI